MHHVDEGKTNTLLRLQIFGQIKVVVNIFEFLVDDGHHLSLVELNGNIFDHQGGLPQNLLIVILFGQKESLKVDLIILGSNKVAFFQWINLLNLLRLDTSRSNRIIK